MIKSVCTDSALTPAHLNPVDAKVDKLALLNSIPDWARPRPDLHYRRD